MKKILLADDHDIVRTGLAVTASRAPFDSLTIREFEIMNYLVEGKMIQQLPNCFHCIFQQPARTGLILLQN